jgi:hypothetical protein
MENPHKIQVRRKRKVPRQEETEQRVYGNYTNNLSLEDMDLQVHIENIHFPDEEQRLQESQQTTNEIDAQEEDFSEEESFTIQNALFDKDSQNLVFEGVNHKNKKGRPHSK